MDDKTEAGDIDFKKLFMMLDAVDEPKPEDVRLLLPLLISLLLLVFAVLLLALDLFPLFTTRLLLPFVVAEVPENPLSCCCLT